MTQKAASEPQASAFPERVDTFLRRRRSWIIAAVCFFAFCRILIFCAAFPLFNPLDEQDHLETVHNYAKGIVSGKELPLSDPEMAGVFALYGSPEYLVSRQRLQAAHLDVPVLELTPELRGAQFQKRFNYWITQRVTEAQSPPVYYVVAAAWYRVGALLGMKDWALAYWVRFLNAILYPLFVWISYLFVKQVYPARDFLCIAVPAFLAVFPQDVFFGVNRDILSPLLAALVLLLLFRAVREEKPSGLPLVVGGFLTGIGFLTDIPNGVLFGVLAVVVFIRTRKALQRQVGPREFAIIASSAVAAALPPLHWMARNRTVMGDFTGSKAKIAFLGWTVKPWPEILHHPIFSLNGAAYFVRHLIPMYWRGEYFWQGNPLRWAVADGFYVISSIVFLAVFLAYIWKQNQPEEWLQRLTGAVSLYLVVASVLFLAAISLPFDFHQCIYPSRELPYFVSGRIICGTLLPFALIYVSALEFVFQPIRRFVHPLIPFAGICTFITCTELALRSDVFHSAFNFFALLRN
jgi:hypothetical protein